MQTYGLNLTGAYDAFNTQFNAARERNKENKLKQLMGGALQGDQRKLAELAGQSPEAFMKVKQFNASEAEADLKRWLPKVYAADTPEKWSLLQREAAAAGRPLGGFETRESTYSEGLDIGTQIGLDLRQQGMAADKAHQDRSFGLQERGFNADEAYRNSNLGIAREELEIKRNAANAGPKPPAGYRYTGDNNLEAIQGGPADPTVKASQGAGGVTTKMRNDAVSVDQAFNNLDTALTNYGTLINKTGVSMMPGQENDQIVQARTNLQLQLKELYNLGVLNGPDLSLMQQMIFDPQTSWTDPIGNVAKIAGGRVPGVSSVGDRATQSIGTLRDMLKTIRDNKTKGILDTNGRFVSGAGPQPQATGQLQIPIDAISDLVADPTSADEFDEVFGEGAAASVLEGQ